MEVSRQTGHHPQWGVPGPCRYSQIMNPTMIRNPMNPIRDLVESLFVGAVEGVVLLKVLYM